MDVNCDNDQAYRSQALPSPTSTPYRTPTDSMSRSSLHQRSSSPTPSRSSSPISPEQLDVDVRGNMLEVNNNDPISLLDPRRFTPTLHASLVSEILSLRRDVESKVKEIEALEINLDHAKSESEGLRETLSQTVKENRSLKRQLQVLEGGSLSAVTELAKERDEALDTVSDIRKRLEQSQKKLRMQEEETSKIQAQWDDDRSKWDEERRNLERKVHVVEGRLKIVLNEVMAAQEANSKAADDDTDNANDASNINETPKRPASVLSRRRDSITNSPQDTSLHYHSSRFSVMSVPNGQVPKTQGVSLADELAFDEEEEDDYADDDDYYGRPDSRATVSRERPLSTQSLTIGMKARKILGLSFDTIEQQNGSDMLKGLRDSEVAENNAQAMDGPKPHRFEYQDAGCQYTPPPFPLVAQESKTFVDASTMAAEAGDDNKKAVQTADIGTNTDSIDVISSSSQTMDESGPTATKQKVPPMSVETKAITVQTASSSTQTDEAHERPMPIPTIAIHPPESNPPSPRTSVVLPPHTKSISCQTDKTLESNVRSTGVQTKEIRIDKRQMKLPASLLPSAIQDHPPATEVDLPIVPYFPPPPKSAKRRLRLPPVVEPPSEKKEKGEKPETIQAYPGNNDNGPLAEDESLDIRRPFRSSSLFAGFDESSSSDEGRRRSPTAVKLAAEDLFSDEEKIMNQPMVHYTLRSGRLVSKPAPDTILDEPKREEDHSPKSGSVVAEPQKPYGSKLRRSAARAKSNARRPKLKDADIRRTAIISSSTVAHAQSVRPRSPSAPSFGSSTTNEPYPPFPIPLRFSSRNIPTSASDGAQSPVGYQDGLNSPDESALRKVRSDVVARTKRARRQPSDSTHTVSTSSAAPDSPALPPPLPHDDITAPRRKRTGRQPRARETPIKENYHQRDETLATTFQQTSVVDAIAQTMVGEWMWKYARRRRSFGVPDNSREQWEMGKTEEVSANISGNGSRHKRWVWIAPYERSIMWSSKQPTSGTALLGKVGRKLVIQSVLDVKDESPLPKGASPQSQFNRSILILTPQRALKFTALSLERHYVWLTALSFLSHSSMNMNELAALPPAPQEEYRQRPPPPALRRNPIRDSIKVAKGKSRWKAPFIAQTPAVPEVPGDANDPGSDDAADPPTIPRFSSHTRKRSNTAPRPSAFRSFSNYVTAQSTTTAGSSDLYSPTSTVYPPGIQSGQSSFSHRTSEASGPSRNGGARPNFFDAVGTVRMEAFVNASDISRYRSGAQRTRHNGRRKREPGHWHQSPETDYPLSEDGGDAFFHLDDPFRGF
ncbi:hypothetical protein VTO42DRAFT_5152 [Malbranchea cinnamomea]